ncbi:MAG: hypothetical protein ACI4ES_16470 [Roseburia sp.]
MKQKKKRQKEQDNIVTAQVIGAGIFIFLFVLCIILLIHVLGSNGASYLSEFVNR